MLKHVFFLICLNRAGDSERADTVFDIIIDWNGQTADSNCKFFVVKSVPLLMTFADFFHKDGFICDRVAGQSAKITGIDCIRTFFFR